MLSGILSLSFFRFQILQKYEYRIELFLFSLRPPMHHPESLESHSVEFLVKDVNVQVTDFQRTQTIMNPLDIF